MSNPYGRLLLASAIALLGAVLLLGLASVGAGASEFSGSVEERCNVFYDIIVESTATGEVEIEVRVDDPDKIIELHTYDTRGRTGDTVYYEVWGEPSELWMDVYSYGVYTLDIEGDDIDGVCEFKGTSNYPIERSSYRLDGSVAEGAEVSYDFNVERTDKAVVILLDWYEYPDALWLRLYDALDQEIEPYYGYSYGDMAKFTFDVETTGTYTAVVLGNKVVSGDVSNFKIESNVLIPPGKEYGASREESGVVGTMGWIGIIVVLVVIVALVLFVLARRSRAAGGGQPAAYPAQQQYPQPQQYAQQQPLQQPQQYAQPQQPVQQQPMQQQPPPQQPPPQQPPPQQPPPQQPPQQQAVAQPVQAPQAVAPEVKRFCSVCGSPLGPDGLCPKCASSK